MVRNDKFTLLELLIVISMIAILLSLLLPSLSKAKEAAKIALCANNQKQMSIGLYGFTQDNDSRLPTSYHSTWDNSVTPRVPIHAAGLPNWDVQIINYLSLELPIDGNFNSGRSYDSPEVFACPSDIRTNLNSKRRAKSYSGNRLIQNPAHMETNFPGMFLNGTGSDLKSRSMAIVSQASRTLLLAEKWGIKDHLDSMTYGWVFGNGTWEEASHGRYKKIFYDNGDHDGRASNLREMYMLHDGKGKGTFLMTDGAVKIMNGKNLVNSSNVTDASTSMFNAEQ